MAQAVDTGGANAPFVKFRNIGDTLIGAFAGSTQRQRREYKQDGSVGELLWKPKVNETDPAKPELEEIFYFVAVGPGCTVVTGKEDDGYNAVKDKETVRYSVRGFKWGQAIEAARTLPAFRDQWRKGQRITGDMWKITLVGFSAQSPGPAATQVYTEAGLSVVEGRVVMRTNEDHMKWVQIQASRRLNTNAAADFEMICRRVLDVERAYEDEADRVYASKPWEKQDVPAEEQPSAVQKGADPWGPSQEQSQQGSAPTDWRNAPLSPEAQQLAAAAAQATQPGPPAPTGPAAGDPWAQPAAPAAASAPAPQGDPWGAPPAAAPATDPWAAQPTAPTVPMTDPSVQEPNAAPPF